MIKLAGKKKIKKEKVKHVKHWKSNKPYNRGNKKIERGKYLKKTQKEEEME